MPKGFDSAPARGQRLILRLFLHGFPNRTAILSLILRSAQVVALGGAERFPFLHDLNTGTTLYESADIVYYLLETYGEGAELPPYLLESTLISGGGQ